MSDTAIGFVNTVFVPAGLMLIMFSLGLTLALSHFRTLFANSSLVGAALAGQLIAMPLLAFAVGFVFGLPPELALALFILGICPAGTTSNALTFVGGGNVALAVVLTAISSLVTVFTIPLLLEWAVPHFLGAGGAPELSVLGTMRQLALITLLPVAVGMVVRGYAPELALRLARWLRPTAMVILVGVIGVSLAISFDMVLANVLRAGPAIWVLNILATLAGLAIARAAGAGPRDEMTVAIEVGVHNATLAIYLTLTVLHSLPLAVTQNIYGVIMLVDAAILIRLYRARIARQGGAPHHQSRSATSPE